ncbi:phage head completion protein [Methylobacterium nodulans]|uniref:phage head completion protein n=1 Tax=Methylobacterium nodulans TaxID=114616 RepID=UPI001FCBD0C1|nr:head-tail adaptor protein [Methylobacterium nodulans]
MTFRQRPVIGDGTDRGDYADAFKAWANYRQESAREAAEGGRAQDVETGTLTIRDSPQARTVTSADRVVILGREFGIEGVGLPDRRTGMITMRISSNMGGQ